MDREPRNRIDRSNHQDEFNSQSHPNNIQWSTGMSFQQCMMQPFNPRILFQQYHGQQGMTSFSCAYPTHPTPLKNMTYSFQSLCGATNQEEEHEYSQPSHIERQSIRGYSGKLHCSRLCHVWVRVSVDSIVESNQKKGSLWSRIFDDFV
ncbi:hypothetical protein Dimus_020942 [Dionaea muscipula]